MLASLSWLRALCPFDGDASVAARALTARGLTVDAVSAGADDAALDIDVPANRPDCLGHLGLARELSAAFGVPLNAPPAEPSAPGPRVAESVRVEIHAPQFCSRYTARIVRGVTIGTSPPWVVRRLETCGLRSINNVVDASNLVMLELGNPVHFFDLDRVSGGVIRIRCADLGERLTTLDGVERELDPSTLVIADASSAIALAGVMGGADSEINPATRDVLVEAAWFLPRCVRTTARRLGLKSDASHRFERGVDPEALTATQNLAVRLLVELAGGVADVGQVDERTAPPAGRRIELRLAQLPRLLGFSPPAETVTAALAALDLAPRSVDERRVSISVPSWRVDLEREADLIEEVARHVGYDSVPTGLAGLPRTSGAFVHVDVEERARDLLTAAGFGEAFGYAMIGLAEDERFVEPGEAANLRLTNPIAEPLACLRRSIVPGLLRAAERNHRRGVRDVRLFEIGHVFRPRGAGDPPDETSRVGMVWSGAARPPHWSEPGRDADLWDIMGLVEELLRGLRPAGAPGREAARLDALHPGRSAQWRVGEDPVLAWAGALHPELQHDLTHELFVAEIDLARLAALPSPVPQYRNVARLTEVSRDLSLLLTAEQPYRDVRRVLGEVPAPAPVRFEVVDRYAGPPLDPGQISLTVRCVLTPDDRTLTEADIESYRQELVGRLHERLGVGLRGAPS